MRNVSVFTLMLLSLLFLVAGCSSDAGSGSTSGGESNTTKLTFWAPFSGGDADFMKAMVDDFNEQHEDIEVDYLTVTFDEYYTKLRTSVTSNQAPDIAIAHSSRIAELQSANLIESLDSPASKANLDWSTYNENVVNSAMVDNQHYGVPLDTHAEIMFVNKMLLDKAGVLNEEGLPVLGEGAEGFTEFLTQIKKSSGKEIFPLSSTSAGNQPRWIWWSLYSQLGGELLNEDGTKAAFNNEKGLQALEYMGGLIDQGLWPKNIQDGGELFLANRAGAHFNGVWMTGAIEQNEALDFVALPFPQLFDEPATWGDSHTFALPVNEKQTEEEKVAALKFADWIAEHAITWAEAGHIPSKTAVIESKEFQALPYRKDYAEIIDYVSFMPPSKDMTAINDLLGDQLSVFTNGGTSAQETLDILEKEVNKIIAN
ncbi:ABC transporter substrate-binding protein [Planococcus shenhongbingii]|uniref:ABC transporter substrate-binding protein n=1 Tax=Planococcus shenhongbingii TaxID=3058398 RepID=UPI0026129AA3|nr:ABC transporter substrate-binding protein [Planococcus sp. N016]WKA60342.1 ABC transporter substrate-binding protein [Planococcus sp. N016]